MACSISITSVAGIGDSPSPDDIVVQGIAEDCAADPADGGQVTVTLSCGDPGLQIGTLEAEVLADGVFIAIFRGVGLRCPCDGPVTVRAACATDAACFDTFTGRLGCADCPTFSNQGDDVGIAKFSVQCEPDGTATVEVFQDVQNFTGSEVNIQIDCGPDHIGAPGGNITNFGPGDTGTATGICRFNTPGTPAPIRVLTLDASLNPTGCPPQIGPTLELEACPPGCAVIRDIAVDISGMCERDPDDDDTEKRRVTFTPVIDGPPPDFFFWNFGDGSTPVSGTGVPGPVEHLYLARPTQEPVLCLSGPGECGQRCASVPLSAFEDFIPCSCPTDLEVTVFLEGCAADTEGGAQKRQVRFVPTVSGDTAATAHVWDFGDGSSPDLGSGPPETVVHGYETPPADPPVLQISGPEGCPDRSVTVPLATFDAFEPCGDGPPQQPQPEEPAEPESAACYALRLLGALFLAIAAFLGLLAACFPALATELGVAAGIAAAIGAILLFIYGFWCPNKPCRWYLRTSAHVLIGGGILALMFSGCCPNILVPAGLGVIAAGIAALGAWAGLCDVSRCDFLVELTIAAGYVLPGAGLAALIDFLGDFPVLATVIDCIDGQKIAAIAGVVSTLVTASIICRTRPDAPDTGPATRN